MVNFNPIGSGNSIIDINQLNDELLLPILSFLPVQTLHECAFVSKRFSRLAADSSLWKALLGQQIGSESINLFSPLVEKELLTWKEAFRLRSLLPFLDELQIAAISTKDKIQEKNPQVRQLRAYAQLDSYMAGYFLEPHWCFVQPMVVNNGVAFCVVNGVDVEMNGQTEPIFKGEPEALITHLAHDGKFLYILRFDGVILQCDPKTGDTRKIETTLSTDADFRLAYQKSIVNGRNMAKRHSMDQFFVNEGYIFIRYHNSAEVIEIKTNKRGLSRDKDAIALPKCLIREKKLYLVGNCIAVWNMETGAKEVIEGDLKSLHLPSLINDHGDIFIGKETVFRSSLKVESRPYGSLPRDLYTTKISRFNLSDGKEQPSLNFAQGTYAGCLVLGDLFFARNSDSWSISKGGIVIFNLSTGKTVGEVVVFDEASKYRTEAFAELISFCLSNFRAAK